MHHGSEHFKNNFSRISTDEGEIMKKTKITAVLAAAAIIFSSVAGVSGGPAASAGSIKMRPEWKMKNLSAYSAPNGLTPNQIRNAYGVNSTVGTGKGKTIALVVAYGSPTLKNDVAAFDAKFGLKNADLEIHDCGVQKADSNWAVETSLDTEWAHVMAPDANLLVVEAVSDDSKDLMAAVDYAATSGAQVVSMSWGTDEEPSLSMEDSHFSNSKVVYVAAAGDDGAKAMWPASSPNVISVGGTTLKLNKAGSRLSEKAWRNSGGGSSRIEAAPSWQREMGIKSATRSTPDVSFDAGTGVSVYFSGSSGHWHNVGGTSLGAPSWAGIVADLNQTADSIKSAGSLYVLAGRTSYRNPGNCFFDITSGSNGWTAAPGYDEVSGLGTPNCASLNQQTAADAAELSAVKNEGNTFSAFWRVSVRRIRRTR